MRPTLPPAQPIILVGSHSTGKTTLALEISKRLGIPVVSEVARQVLAEGRYPPLAKFSSDIHALTRYQREVALRQIAAERQFENYVSDRGLCHLAYSAARGEIGMVANLLADGDMAAYIERTRRARVFFVRPHRELLEQDGVRDMMDWESVVRIDGAIMMALAMLDIPYVPIESLAMADRLRVVLAVVR